MRLQRAILSARTDLKNAGQACADQAPTKPAANSTTGHEVGGAGAAGLSPFSLKDDVAPSNDMLAARNHRGVSISLGNGVMALRGADIRTLAADLDAMAELGAPRINGVGVDPGSGPQLRPDRPPRTTSRERSIATTRV
jgi:hypothetical protein